MSDRAAAIVLAAGRGTRMRSATPKVVESLGGRPMILYVVDALEQAGFAPDGDLRPILVVGFGEAEVRSTVGTRAKYVTQAPPLGTGDAVRVGLGRASPGARWIVVVHGDEPFIEAETFRTMLQLAEASGSAVVLLTGDVTHTQSLGRVIRDDSGSVVRLCQERELSDVERQSHEINFGAYVFDRSFLEVALADLKPHVGGEFYLTDVVEQAVNQGLLVETVSVSDPDRRMGINDRAQLERAERFLAGVEG